MIVFYVYGAGLGHLTRVLNYIKYKELALENCMILTNSSYYEIIPKPTKVLYKPDSFFKEKNNVIKLIESLNFREIIVDVFPQGFYGELRDLGKLNIKKTLLVRLLNSSYFKSYPSKTVFNEIIILEKGIDLNLYNYKKATNLELKKQQIEASFSLELNQSFFYILHSGPKEEVRQLYKMAKLYQKKEELIIIQTRNMFKVIDSSVVFLTKSNNKITYLNECQRLFTACGFNTFYETEKYRSKQCLIPFKRKYDNQFKRKLLNEIV